MLLVLVLQVTSAALAAALLCVTVISQHLSVAAMSPVALHGWLSVSLGCVCVPGLCPSPWALQAELPHPINAKRGTCRVEAVIAGKGVAVPQQLDGCH